MSARYVWDIYGYEQYWEDYTSAASGRHRYYFTDNDKYLGDQFMFYIGTDLWFKSDIGEITAVGGRLTNYGVWIDASVYPYIQRGSRDDNVVFESKGRSGYWCIRDIQATSTGRYTADIALVSYYNSVTPIQYVRHKPVQRTTLLNRYGQRSSDVNTTYPKDGIYDDVDYYKLLGSDSIDPEAISYSDVVLKPDEPVIVTVHPSVQMKFKDIWSKTVYYKYEYSTNGTTWTAFNFTTATNQQFIIPRGAEQFQVRVLASDEIGFTSKTYVYGPLLGVDNVNAYIGVSNKAKKVYSVYVGVNGIAREVASGYVGVNGKARPWY